MKIYKRCEYCTRMYNLDPITCKIYEFGTCSITCNKLRFMEKGNGCTTGFEEWQVRAILRDSFSPDNQHLI